MQLWSKNDQAIYSDDRLRNAKAGKFNPTNQWLWMAVGWVWWSEVVPWCMGWSVGCAERLNMLVVTSANLSRQCCAKTAYRNTTVPTIIHARYSKTTARLMMTNDIANVATIICTTNPKWVLYAVCTQCITKNSATQNVPSLPETTILLIQVHD